MSKPFRMEAVFRPVAEMIRALDRPSARRADTLGKDVYVNADPRYLVRQEARMRETLRRHRETAGDRPAVLLRAPGRLNAFLEYLDMCDGDHMSTTIDGDIPLAVSPREDDVLRAVNVNPLFPEERISLREAFRQFAGTPPAAGESWDRFTLVHPHRGREQGHWFNYVLAPWLRAAWDHPELKFRGADLTFGPATVPFRAGTSSSSAMVVLAFLAMHLTNRDILPAQTISEVCRFLGEAEWYVGTHGGANDQMTILLNPVNSVSYNRHSRPELEATALPFLENVHVVLANSLWEINKSSEGNQSFNMRKGWMQMGDELARRIIAAAGAAAGTPGAAGEGWLARLIQTQFGYAVEGPAPHLEGRPEYWRNLAARYRKFGSLDETVLGIPDAAITEFINLLPVKLRPDDAGRILGLDPAAVGQAYTRPRRDIGGYHLRTTARFFHRQNIIGRRLEQIFREAHAGVAAGRLSPASAEYDAYRVEVGRMVDDLQDALSFDFRVSIPQIDLLLSIAKRGPGYLGGKLTGAGKGGCVSLLVRGECSRAMCEHLDREYYRKPERFEYYRMVLADDLRYAAPGSREAASAAERRGILEEALRHVEDQRRVVTFSRGACALDLAAEASA
ncbi:MAG: hypothetical protein V1809_02125 [Planctomycetota bacterium]